MTNPIESHQAAQYETQGETGTAAGSPGDTALLLDIDPSAPRVIALGRWSESGWSLALRGAALLGLGFGHVRLYRIRGRDPVAARKLDAARTASGDAVLTLAILCSGDRTVLMPLCPHPTAGRFMLRRLAGLSPTVH